MNGSIKCPYCDRTFKRLTANHIKTHNVTWDEYLQEYRCEDYKDNQIVEFLSDFYITVRSKYLIYKLDGKKINPITVKENKDKNIYKLHNGLLKQHVKQRKTLGIFFPNIGTRLIGLDLDSDNIDHLESVYNAVIQYIPEECILVTFSGNKGYHIDIFSEDIISRDIVKRFYQLILNDAELTDKQLELRGANNQGYKLPFGIHQLTQNYCYPCNKFGVEIIKLDELIKSRRKSKIDNFIDAVNINCNSNKVIDILSNQDKIDFEEIQNTVKPLENYKNLNSEWIASLEEIYRTGFKGVGMRNNYTFKVALYVKCILGLDENETLKEMLSWMDRCSGYKDPKCTFKCDIENTVKRIFKNDMKLVVAAKEIKISRVEIKEILSVLGKTKLQTQALRRLYYMFFLHSKAYGDKDGCFNLTYDQMEAMGARKQRGKLSKDINILIEYGKIYKYPTKRIARNKNAPGKYKLIALADIPITTGTREFKMCSEMRNCSNCLECATCYLIRNNTELRKYYTGRRAVCEFNRF